MFSFKVNLSVYILAVWLVLLQVLSPFVHAHLDANVAVDQGHGLHLHTVNFAWSDKQLHQGQHNIDINDDAFETHVVEIGKGLIKKFEPLLAIALIFSFFIFPFLSQTTARIRPKKQVQYKSIYFRGCHSPRSPPYC